MGRNKKETVELVVPNGPEIDNSINTGNTIELIKEEIIETPTESSIHDTYRTYINQARSNYLHGLNYSDSIKILRWTEKKTGRSIPMNTSCPACMINLLKLFGNLENK